MCECSEAYMKSVCMHVLGSFGLLLLLQWADMWDRAVLTHSCPSSLAPCVSVLCGFGWLWSRWMKDHRERKGRWTALRAKRQREGERGKKADRERDRGRERERERKMRKMPVNTDILCLANLLSVCFCVSPSARSYQSMLQCSTRLKLYAELKEIHTQGHLSLMYSVLPNSQVCQEDMNHSSLFKSPLLYSQKTRVHMRALAPSSDQWEGWVRKVFWRKIFAKRNMQLKNEMTILDV